MDAYTFTNTFLSIKWHSNTKEEHMSCYITLILYVIWFKMGMCCGLCRVRTTSPMSIRKGSTGCEALCWAQGPLAPATKLVIANQAQ